MFKRLLNVEDMVAEDVSLDDSPLRDAPVLVARVRCGKGAALLALRAKGPEIRQRRGCVASSSGVPFERGKVYQVIGWFVAV